LSPRKTQSLGTIAKSLLSVVFAAGLVKGLLVKRDLWNS